VPKLERVKWKEKPQGEVGDHQPSHWRSNLQIYTNTTPKAYETSTG